MRTSACRWSPFPPPPATSSKPSSANLVCYTTIPTITCASSKISPYLLRRASSASRASSLSQSADLRRRFHVSSRPATATPVAVRRRGPPPRPNRRLRRIHLARHLCRAPSRTASALHCLHAALFSLPDHGPASH